MRTTAAHTITLTPAAIILAVAILIATPAQADMDYDATCAGAISARRDQIFAPAENPPYRPLTADKKARLRSLALLNDNHFYGKYLCADDDSSCFIQPEFKRKHHADKAAYVARTPKQLDDVIAACRKSVKE